MNLRTLKKLSKRAAPLLPLLGDTRKQFRAEPYDNYGIPFIGDRKHWERHRLSQDYEPRNNWSTRRGQEIILETRDGGRVLLSHPDHPRKGTMMVGATSGYYEPEWDEETAYRALLDLVHEHYTDYRYDPEADDVDRIPLRTLNTPREVFQAASDILAERRQ